MSNLAWLIVGLVIVAVAIGGYVVSLLARTKTLEKRLESLQDQSH
jgi:CcmD family protein